MKTTSLKQFLPLILAMALGVNQAEAQVFSTLHFFDGDDGAFPFTTLVLSSNTLYGETEFANGTIFAVKTDGSDFTNLYNFNDGVVAGSDLTLSGSTLYGSAGGVGGVPNPTWGAIFAIHTDGSGFTNLYNFTALSTNADGIATNGDGALPNGLLLSSNLLYGTTDEGGVNGNGTVFAINVDGACFTNLHNFSAGNTNALGIYTNSNGANSHAILVLSGDTLYGTTVHGGVNGFGTVFALHTDGTGFTNLYNFTGGSDGANPDAGLLLSGNTLYGTAAYGGTNDAGTVFAINTDGTGFTNWCVFDGGAGPSNPQSSLILSGNTLYGTASGGTNSDGAVFAINTDGTGFIVLHEFNGLTDGYSPVAGVILSGNTLYGTTFGGRTNPDGNGTVFSLSLGPIPLNIQSSGQTPILTWGNPAFSLQTASAPAGPWVTLSNAASPFTLDTTNAQAFFQLVSTNNP